MVKRAALVATVLFGVFVGSASAADVPVSTTMVTDGPVNAVTYDPSGRAYVGGSFFMVGPRLGSGLALTNASDVPAAGFPDINGRVEAAVPDGAGGEFIGGTFTSVGGVPRNRLAHIKADGTLDAGWNPSVNNTVRALALSPAGETLYVGGDFTGANAIGGQNHSRLAKLSATTGTVDADWHAGASGSVRALAASGSSLYVGGSFGVVFADNADAPGKLAKVDAAGAGDVDTNWTTQVTGGSKVNALALSGPDLYVGGDYFQVNGTNRAGLAKVASGSTGALDATWNPDPNGEVFALQASGTDLFVGGFYFSVGDKNRAGLAKLATTGAGDADPTWDPAEIGTKVNALALSGGELLVGGEFFGIGGAADRPFLAKLATTGTGAATSWKPNPNDVVLSLATSGSSIFAGGEFSSAGPQNKFRGALIRLNANGSLDEAWDPQVSPGVFALSLQGTELIIGGDFTRVHTTSRFGLAKLSTEGSGAMDATWATQAFGVKALARSGDDLFVGGDFTGPNSVGNQTRSRIAKVSATGTGVVDATWDPNAVGGAVNALAVSGSDLFVGGAFFDIGGQPRSGLAKLQTTSTGAADATWVADTGTVNAVLVSGTSLFVGGLFVDINGEPRGRLAKLSTTGAAALDPTWKPNPNGVVTSLALSGDNLYAGGGFGTIGGQPRNRLARLSPTGSGAVDPAFEPAASNNAGPVIALAATPSRVLVGGSFSSIGPLSTANLAVFDLTTPTLSLTSPFEGARYRQGQVVPAAYACDDPDGEADTVACTGNVAAGAPIDTASAGAKTFTATATDAGSRSVSSTVNYFVDGSAPEITLTIPSQDAVYAAGTQIPVTFACADEDGPADIASCAGTAPAGSRLDVSVNGTHTFTVSSADAVGNTSTRTVTYRVTGNPEAPLLSAFSLKPAKFKAKRGTKVSFELSKAATVTFKVTRKKGRKTVTVGSFSRKAKKGKNSFGFRGKVKGKTLKPGSYRMAARANDKGGLRSKTVSKAFRVLKP
jgi:trimeric autotransporter adhesin